ncbi:Nuclear transcription factor Y subunit B-6, partial [Mucuna pruriens]
MLPLQQTNTSAIIETPTPINPTNNSSVPNLALRDKTKMPISNVTKIMRQILPTNAKISANVKEMIQQSATKYVTFVTRKAKERCQNEYRKIMNAEDLLWAIEKLGFNDYVGPLTTFLNRYRSNEGSDLLTRSEESIPHLDNNELNIEHVPNPMPTLEMHHPDISSLVPSLESNFSIDPNTNMEMFDPNDKDKFFFDEFDVGFSNDESF